MSNKIYFNIKRFNFFLVAGLLLLFSSTQAIAQTASFTVVQGLIGCAPFDNSFANTSTGATSYAWEFGDGASSNGNDTVVHTFGQPGVYNVKLTAYNGAAKSEKTITITVFDKPNVAFTSTNPMMGCKQLKVQFKDSSVNTGTAAIVKYEWTFGDGIKSELKDPLHHYTSALLGVIKYQVFLTITDANGCSNTTAPKLAITSDPPQTSFVTNPNPAAACSPPLNVVFTNTSASGTTYSWNYGQGSKSTRKDSTINYTTNGSFTVKLVATDPYNCPGSFTSLVNINKPKADFGVAGINDTVCKKMTFINKSTGGFASWNYGDNTSGSFNDHTYSKGGFYMVKLTSFAGSCSDTISRKIFVEDAKADFITTPHYSCQLPFTASYTDKSTNAVKWRWEFENDSTTSILKNPTNIYKADTIEYGVNRRIYFTNSLYITTKYGCKDSITKVNNDTIFRPNALFKVSIAQGCVPLVVAFTDSSTSKEKITDYTWEFGDGTKSSGTAKNITHSYGTAGKYRARLIVTNSKGCKDTSYYKFIMAGNIPQPDFSFTPTTVCVKTPVQFTDLTPASNKIDTWHYTGDGGYMSACPNEKNPSWSFDSDSLGLRNISLTVGSNGCYASKTKAITVKGPWVKANSEMECSKPFEYNFNSTVLDGDSWTWDFGDASAIDVSNNLTPIHTYATTGDYTVTLTGKSSSSGCSVYTDKITVKVRNLKASITTDSTFCASASNPFDGSKSKDVYSNCHTGYRWDFGDTTQPYISDGSTMPHVFNKNGLKNVRLIVKDVNGCQDTAFQKVFVSAVKAKFTLATKPICLPSDVELKSESTGDTTLVKWRWNIESVTLPIFDTIAKVTFNRMPTLDIDKKFMVTLTVTDTLGCTNSVTKFVQASIPDSTFTVTRNLFCTGSKDIQFKSKEAGPKSTFLWDFQDGSDTTVKSPFHIFTTAGRYRVKLTVTDSIGCRDSSYLRHSGSPIISFDSLTVRNRPQVGFTIDKVPPLCYPLPITFIDTSRYSTSRIWDVGSGAPVDTNGRSTSFTYNVKGSYNVSLIVNNDGNCPDSTHGRKLVVVGPEATFSLTKDHICLGEGAEFIIDPKDTVDVFSYGIDYGDGKPLVLGNAADLIEKNPYTYSYRPVSGSITAQLFVYSGPNQTGCPFSYSKKIIIDQTIADFDRNNEIDTTVCVGTPISIVNKSIDADLWSWNMGDGTPDKTIKEVGPLYTFTVAKTYDVVLTAKNSNSITHCSDIIKKKIVVHPLPDLKADGAGTICPIDPAREKLNFVASGAKDYLWSPALGLSAADIPNPVATPAVTTTYTVLVTDTNKCKASDTLIAVVIQKAPELTLDTTIVIEEIVSVNLDLGNGYTYLWDPTDALTCSTCPNPSAQPLKDILYTLQRADTAKCYSSASTYNVIVKPLTSIDVPGAFTPNGDSHNDKVFLRGWGIKKVIEFKIYNRWGQLVFETSDINEGWDGYYKGELQNTETYVYHAIVETYVKDKNLTKKGTIDLLR